MNLFLVDAHLKLSDLNAPLLNDVRYKLHALVLQHLLRVLLIELIIVQNLLQQLRVDVRPLPLHHLKQLTVHQLLLYLVLRHRTLAFYVVHHLRCRIQHRRQTHHFL